MQPLVILTSVSFSSNCIGECNSNIKTALHDAPDAIIATQIMITNKVARLYFPSSWSRLH
ncbi:hypothetical protein FRX31_013151 [Thalictrum thalictroides]|uniref:Uncharacterized protein n=1 Tax=Thalictrum thalictroides TaxID=46969 RepID=A0A7J6WIR9_THATH|nr:hypothetical protein FRX31_013151 [Thalictrum thalictroides]